MEPEERELVKGLIYVTDFRKPNKTQQEQVEHFEAEFYDTFSSTTNQSPSTNDIDQILMELKELQIKSFHLDRSNKEIQELDPSWNDDPVLRDAIVENTSILHRYKKRIEYLKQTLHARHALPSNLESQLQALQEQILQMQEQIHQQEEQRGIEQEQEMNDDEDDDDNASMQAQPSSSIPSLLQDMEEQEQESSEEVYL